MTSRKELGATAGAAQASWPVRTEGLLKNALEGIVLGNICIVNSNDLVQITVPKKAWDAAVSALILSEAPAQ